MAINKEEAIKLFEQLPKQAQQSALDFMKYLADRSRPDWEELARMEPDTIPLSEEEERQMKAREGFLSGEDAKREFNLQVDLP